jgi:Reverse transcriptase (RNA-dependent DNA polymerase)
VLPQAGLLQGSLLSPILFLFFNADLVQYKISNKGGAVAFVDDYTAWVTGSSAEANYRSIQAIVDRAVQWERRSGATFESSKTAFIHFTRTATRLSVAPIRVKNKEVFPQGEICLLGV